MPLTALDTNTALIIVDLQQGIVGDTPTFAMQRVVQRSRALLDAFRAQRLPIVLVNVAGIAPGRTERPRRSEDFPAGWTDFIPALNQQVSDLVVTERTWGAFANTNLDAQLKTLNVTQVVITGVATGTGVESTARQAFECGFHVTLAIDAMMDPRPEAHDYSIKNIFPRLGETGTAQEIIDLLESRRH
jgi:nicotinamidase-related amidase